MSVRADRFIEQWIEKSVEGDRFIEGEEDPFLDKLTERFTWSATRSGLSKQEIDEGGSIRKRLMEGNNRKAMASGLGHISEED